MRLFIIPLLMATAITSIALVQHSTAEAETIGIDVGTNWFCSADFQAQPCVRDISVGDTVTWTIVQGTHTATECDEGHVNCGNGFDSGFLATGESFSQTFGSAGTVSYYCAIHPDMTGVLNVQEASTPSPTPAPTSSPVAETAPPTATPAAVPPTGGPPTPAGMPLALGLGLGLLLTISGAAVVAASRRA